MTLRPTSLSSAAGQGHGETAVPPPDGVSGAFPGLPQGHRKHCPSVQAPLND